MTEREKLVEARDAADAEYSRILDECDRAEGEQVRAYNALHAYDSTHKETPDAD